MLPRRRRRPFRRSRRWRRRRSDPAGLPSYRNRGGNIMSRLSRLWLPVLLFGLAVLPAAPVAPPPAPNAVAATVNGQPVPEMALYRALRPVPPAKQTEAKAEIL